MAAGLREGLDQVMADFFGKRGQLIQRQSLEIGGRLDLRKLGGCRRIRRVGCHRSWCQSCCGGPWIWTRLRRCRRIGRCGGGIEGRERRLVAFEVGGDHLHAPLGGVDAVPADAQQPHALLVAAHHVLQGHALAFHGRDNLVQSLHGLLRRTPRPPFSARRSLQILRPRRGRTIQTEAWTGKRENLISNRRRAHSIWTLHPAALHV